MRDIPPPYRTFSSSWKPPNGIRFRSYDRIFIMGEASETPGSGFPLTGSLYWLLGAHGRYEFERMTASGLRSGRNIWHRRSRGRAEVPAGEVGGRQIGGECVRSIGSRLEFGLNSEEGVVVRRVWGERSNL